MKKYNNKKIERHWQKVWAKSDLYAAEDWSEKQRYYCLVEFPYPSGDGLHVGHVRSYTAIDIIARKKRMQGMNVLYPIGWDAFGLPTENYAIKTGKHPAIVTAENIKTFKRQIKSLGISFDWNREINTTDPNYYKWTQWIFLKLFEKGLAYKKKMPINWCPKCKIGLANEEVIDGSCERCGTQTEKREMEQWMLKITAYADRLIEDLETVDYLEKIKTQQINWIGRSYGAEIDFQIQGREERIKVFTTRPDTIFGATFIVLSPEHELVNRIVTTEQEKDVLKYQAQARAKSELERTQLQKEKTGVFTGAYAVNPATHKEIPIYIADYVLTTYGTGAIMAVPAHDERDFEFAKKYEIPIVQVIQPPKIKEHRPLESNIASAGAYGHLQSEIEDQCWSGEGTLVNSSTFNGLDSEIASSMIVAWLEKENIGKKTTQYHLRDWVFSRQHYWGEPIPIVYCEKCGAVPLPEKDLPLELPMVERYEPTDTGESPLASIDYWVKTTCPDCGSPARRETDTMPNWAGSSWYFLRYIDPKNKKQLADSEKLKYWMPVDLYNGGMEHTTLHLLYSRFWNKFLYDINVSPVSEPYYKRISHGMILAPDGQKMSKSRGNVINPDELVEEYGADVLRLYEMFMGPYDQPVAWDLNGVRGIRRFLEKIYSFDNWNENEGREIISLLHKSIKKISDDIEKRHFNTAVSTMMIFVNKIQEKGCSKKSFQIFLQLLSPFAPHLAEELWNSLGNNDSIFREKWPEYDASLIVDEEMEIVVQINGKLRDKLVVSADIDENEVKTMAKESEKARKFLEGKEPKKIIYVKGKLVNIVV
ncbi:leucine--tRNA ligase [Patescibacteria group bacterium]|nr:leucine--tRNA ligase [Patescibacteria group bacterium]